MDIPIHNMVLYTLPHDIQVVPPNAPIKSCVLKNIDICLICIRTSHDMFVGVFILRSHVELHFVKLLYELTWSYGFSKQKIECSSN